MALDPNQFDNEKIPLTADDGLDDAYDADMAQSLSLTPVKKKPPIALILLLVGLVGAGGAYFAYETMIGSSDDMPAVPYKPIDMAPPAPVDNAAAVTSSVQDPAQAGAVPVPANGAPVDGAPVDPAVPPTTELPPPVDPNAPPVTAPVAGTEAATAPVAGDVAANPAVAPTTPASPAVEAEAIAPPAAPTESVPPAPVAPTDAPAVAPVAAPTGAPVAAMPAVEQPLQPVDTQPQAPAAVMPEPTALQKKTADTMAAVQEILGQETLPSPVSPKAAPAKAALPVEVISRAQQVIKVTKTYSAQSPQAMLAAGDRVLADDQYQAAADIYEKQLRQNPSDLLALSGKAMALQKSGHALEAMDAYQRLIELNPRDVDALTNYLGLLQKQKPEEAMTRLNTLAEQYPDNAAVSGQIGAVFASQMDTPNALRHFMKAKALDDQNPTYPFNIAVLYDRMGNGIKAKSFYRDALEIVRDNPSKASLVPVQNILNRLRSVDR